MSVLRGLTRRSQPAVEARSSEWFNGTLAELLGTLAAGGGQLTQTLAGGQLSAVDTSFLGYTRSIYKSSGPVASVMMARRRIFSQLRFEWQDMADGHAGRLNWDDRLAPLDRPWPGAATSNLLGQMLNHVDLAGNAYVVFNEQGHLRVLRPDRVSVVIGFPGEVTNLDDTHDPDAVILGHVYTPPAGRPRFYQPGEIAHFAPEPDPEAWWRGMSWLTPVIQHAASHKAATDHKAKFFTQGATPNMVLSWDATVSIEKLKAFKELFEDQYSGIANAYKTMFLGGGGDATVVGQDFKQLDFKTVQGADETMIASAGGVPPIIAGFSEGLAAGTYSNYREAKRQFHDITITDLGLAASTSLEAIIPARSGQRLWYSTYDVPFFRQDAKDEAEVHQSETLMIARLTENGWDPETVKEAVLAGGDWSKLEHTGRLSVQLHTPGSEEGN